MVEAISMEKVYREIIALKKEVAFIKNNMIDQDTIMTEEEEEAYEKAMKEHEAGNTKKVEDVKRELGD